MRELFFRRCVQGILHQLGSPKSCDRGAASSKLLKQRWVVKIVVLVAVVCSYYG